MTVVQVVLLSIGLLVEVVVVVMIVVVVVVVTNAVVVVPLEGADVLGGFPIRLVVASSCLE